MRSLTSDLAGQGQRNGNPFRVLTQTLIEFRQYHSLDAVGRLPMPVRPGSPGPSPEVRHTVDFLAEHEKHQLDVGIRREEALASVLEVRTHGDVADLAGAGDDVVEGAPAASE